MTAPASTATVAAAGAAAASLAGNPVAEVARAFYALLALLSRRGEQEARAVWRQLDPADLRGSWRSLGAQDRLMAGVGSLQELAVLEAERYLRDVLSAQGVDPDPVGSLVTDALTGVASDGRDLDDLMFQPVIGTLTEIGAGVSLDQAVAHGEESLATIVNTQVSDTGRAATEVATAVQPRVTKYVRMLVPPSCGRCAVLAGKEFRVSAGFQRHPRQSTMRLCAHSRIRKHHRQRSHY